jgi:hypothetical protein
MKLSGFSVFRSLLNYLSRIPIVRPSSMTVDRNAVWHLLLSGFNARILVACRKNPNNSYRIFFRHNFPGFARIELLVCHRMPDGSVRMLTNVYGSGYARHTLTDGRNILTGGPGCNISIVSMSVRYIAYGITYQLHMDAAEGRQTLLKEGKPYPHGPQYTLALRSLPLINSLPAPITTPHTRTGKLPLSLAAC